MRKSKRINTFLLLAIILLSFVISGCTPQQQAEPSETANNAYPYTLEQLLSMQGINISDIQSASILRRTFDSTMVHYNESKELNILITSLNQGYALITKSDFDTLCNSTDCGLLFLDFGDKETSFYILPNHNVVMKYDESYYISEDIVNTFIGTLG